jgi:hypothetical protein
MAMQMLLYVLCALIMLVVKVRRVEKRNLRFDLTLGSGSEV